MDGDNMANRKSATTIYIDPDTLRLAKEVAGRWGQPISGLFREFLQRIDRLPSKYDIAVVSGDTQVNATLIEDSTDSAQPLFAGESRVSEDPLGFKRIIDKQKTKKVFLMGTTMRRAIVGEEDLWSQLLSGGTTLRILLQGNIGADIHNPLYTPVISLAEAVRKQRDESIESLKRLAANRVDSMLEVRDISTLIAYSAVVIVRNDDTADIQIHPYIFTDRPTKSRPPRFMVNTPVSSDLFQLLVDPIEELWSKSTHVYGSQDQK
jgi:hypothetical protein